MESNRTAIHELFSRGSTPPNQFHQQFPPAQQSNNPSPNNIDALFQHISAPVDQHPQQQQQGQQSTQGADNTASSAPVTPVVPLTDDPLVPSPSASVSTASDRQSALLSLLGGPPPNSRPPAHPSSTSMPTQVPTPPGSSQRSNASPGHNENQGKILLEQLMAAGYVLFSW